MMWQLWLCLGVGLLILELCTGTFYLMILAGVFAITSLLTWIFDLSVVSSLIFTSIVSTIILILFYGKRKKHSDANHDLDIGQKVKVEEVISDGVYRVRYRGTTWEAKSKNFYVVGEMVKIQDKDSNILII